MQLDLKEHDNFLGLNQHYSNILCHRLLNMDKHLYHVGSSQTSMLRTAFNLISYGTSDDSIAGVQYLTCVLASLNYLTAVPEQSQSNEQLNNDISQALKYIEQNIENPITLQELAEVSNYSLSRFKTKFKEELGITPAEYITLQKDHRCLHHGHRLPAWLFFQQLFLFCFQKNLKLQPGGIPEKLLTSIKDAAKSLHKMILQHFFYSSKKAACKFRLFAGSATAL